ncbi:ABC transporter substrate-binding protein [Bacillus sp. J14TS2]|uniref:ABC transporter substrate-binding protein n=1 Tax=Bacillus sp. J14TS2 TaxID=2807188 RepID=UPI001B1B47A9|nr:sugar ABC transporter substrate-binding protein [Bacillus sp. J14TS2]GIN71403.1 ABC transporter substrate-binding protein [Bacillus sp. J14TS2]
MKKIWSICLIMIAFLGIVAGCSSGAVKGENSDANSSKNDNEKVSLKMAVFPDDEATFERVYEEFTKDHPNIEITFESFPQQQFYEKIRMQLSGGEGYDLFTGQMDQMIDTGLLASLDEYIKEADVDVSGYGTLYDTYKHEDEVKSLPYRKSNTMLYYNKTLFDEQGVDYPSDDMTWEEFRELAKKLTNGSGDKKVYGAFIQPWPQLWYMSAVQSGVSIIDKDLTPFTAALQLRLDMENDGSIMKWSEQVTSGAHYNAAFQKGNVAMNIIGDWHVSQLREAEEEGDIDFDWDVVPVPHPEGVEKNTTTALPVTIMMNNNTKYPKEAFEFLRYATGKEGAIQFASDGYLTGYMNDEVKEAYMGDGSQKPKNLHYFLEAKEYSEYPMLQGVKNIVVEQIFKQEGELALIGEQSVEEAIENITKRVETDWASKYGDE